MFYEYLDSWYVQLQQRLQVLFRWSLYRHAGSELHIMPSSPCWVQADQFGICVAPHAAPRAWLAEHGHGDVVTFAHTAPAVGVLVAQAAKDSITVNCLLAQGTLVRAAAKDLAPVAPAITLS